MEFNEYTYFEYFTSGNALTKWFKKSADFRAKIEGSQPLPGPGDLNVIMTEDSEEVVDGEDNEDVPIELSTLVVVGAENVILPTGYKTVGDGFAYDEALDEEAELLISDLKSDGESDVFEDCE